jgi:hypothetical protein
MKPRRERGYDPNLDDRDKAAAGPMDVEPIAPRERRTLRYGKAAVVLLLVAAAVAAAAYGRFAGLTVAAPTKAPPPTPISWSDETVAPTNAVPAQSALPPLSIDVEIPGSFHWNVGSANHFTLTLANRTGADIILIPCPTYRMYVAGADPAEAPGRVLNCAAIGPSIGSGESVKLDMAYTPSDSGPMGKQTLVWQWLSPSRYQAIATADVYLAP